MPTVSLCMIVKNEADILSRCLESIKDGVDEIIIVDTGSSDETKEVASRFTEKIFDFYWNDDFSAARNYSFSKASMDYIMWLDADDVFTDEDFKAFLRLKNEIAGADIVMLKYNTSFDDAGKPIFYYYRERIIRNNGAFEWKGRVHEAIEPSGHILYSDVAVAHKSKKSEYSDRNLSIYKKQITEGEEMTPRDMFYFGRELYYHKKYEEARTVIYKFLSDNNGWIENNIEACKILSYCYIELNNADSSVESLFKALKYDVPRADICCEIGERFMNMGKYSLAAFWFELALKCSVPKGGAFVSIDYYGYIPCMQLCVCYDKLKELKKAEMYNRLAGTYKPASSAYLYNLNYFDKLFSHSRNEF